MNSTTAPAPGAAGVPILATSAKTAIKKILDTLNSYPPHVAINTAAITCMIAVPSILIVIPRGNTKLEISSCTPSSSVVVFKFKGKVAALEEVEKPNNATLTIFLTNGIGFNFAKRAIKVE